MKRDVVPGVARRGAALAALAVGPLGVDFPELGVAAVGFPAHPQRDAGDVETEVVHGAGFTAKLILAFPVDGLFSDRDHWSEGSWYGLNISTFLRSDRLISIPWNLWRE